VNDLTFMIEPGTLVTLLGPSGCGKTTTLRLIAGLEIVTHGRISIGGVDVTHLPASERDVSMVFQSYALFPHMSVFENVAYGPKVLGLPKQKIDDVVHEKLALLGLAGLERRSPAELSGGQQQRVAIARAIVLEPQVLLFDEPLSNLDAKLRRRVRDEIRDLQRKLNLTVAYVTHDQEEALAVSDRIILVDDGGIAQAGAPIELYEQPVSLFVAGFIGEANLIDAELVAVDGESAAVRLGPFTLDLLARGSVKGPVKLAIRPETITVHAVQPHGPTLDARILRITYLGSHFEYRVDTALGTLLVIDRAKAHPLSSGSEVWITFANRGVSIVPTGPVTAY
jgi:iron(III) transport system ATP-binding protein